MEYLKNLIEKFSAPSTESVGVYISSDSKLEVVVFDRILKQVKRCEKTDVKYDNVLRLVNAQDFEAALIMLVNKMDIPSNYPYYVCLPNILTSIKTFPSDLEDIELEVALNSEAEKSYIFKKAEPVASWNLLSTSDQSLTSTYIYSVLQKEQADSIQQVFSNNNLKLYAIDTSFSSLLRGLAASGILSKNFDENIKWAIVTVSFNNYIIAKFEGKTLVNIIETPLALKSIEPEILYPTISSAITEKLGSEPVDNLYLVSQTSDFLAEKLTNHIKLFCNIYSIDNNKFKGNPLFISPMVTAIEPTSPESVGTACWDNSAIDINFNFSSLNTKSQLQGFLGTIIKKNLHLYLIIAMVVSIVLIAIVGIVSSGINGFLEAQIRKETIEVTNLKKLSTPAPKVFDMTNVIYQTYNKNLEVLNAYDAIGASIPEKLWLESFFIDGDLNTIIKGNAYSVEDIVIYFENLQKLTKFKNLKIKHIKVAMNAESPVSSDNYNREGDIPLPLPPVLEEGVALGTQNYYEFVFNDTNETVTEKTFTDKLPESVRKLFGN
ncbi:MAG: hypothetical protein A2Y25_09335 [Candidatus Melainabacteria bacterium GWF2_37_15]|nr:MAG: hypothetical protein A2Y25_09335 [Candidatus Melainabacteria bacterium GWF2_37_15]